MALPEPEAHAPARCPEAWQQARAWAFSGDGRLFAVAQPGRVEVYETGTWRRRFSLPVAWYAESLQLSEDGRWLYVWFWPPPEQVPALLAVVDTKSGAELGRRESGEHDVESGFVSAPDGSWIAVVARSRGLEAPYVELVTLPDFSIRSIDAEKGPWREPKRPKWTPRKLPPGSGLPNGGADWSADSVDGPDPPRPRALRASEDSSRLIVEWIGDQSPRTSVVDALSGRTLARLRGGDPHLSSEWLSLLRPSGAITLWDFRTDQGQLFYDPLCTSLAERAAPLFRADGTLVAFPGHPHACLVETLTGKLVGTLPKGLPAPGRENDYLVPEQWTSDGQAVVLRSGEQLLMTRSDGEPLELPGAPLAASLSGEPRVFRRARDRSLFWLGDTSFPALEWRASMLRELVVPEGLSSSTVVSDDGELFLRRREQPLVLRSTRDSTVQATLVGDGLVFLGFDPTGRWVVTSTPDHELTVWDVAKSHAELGVPGCMGESDE